MPVGYYLKSRQPPRYSSLAKQNFNYEKRQKEMAKKKKKEEKRQKKLDKTTAGPEGVEGEELNVEAGTESDSDPDGDGDDEEEA